MIPWLDSFSLDFPSPEQALHEPNGLLAAGGGLEPERILAAYSQGIFPWYMPDDPILWWSPNPRMVLFPDELHIPRSLAKTLRNCSYEIRFDTAFPQVMTCCAAPRKGASGTWISQAMQDAYCDLHRMGYAHSVETWIDGELAGGLYGVALGDVFYGESMFALKPDASKIAFARLVPWLAGHGFRLIDCQMRTDHLTRFGGREIPRREFCTLLTEFVAVPRTPRLWHHDIIHGGSGTRT
ncbi:leucyl/phenylalanyl-tRNA--protein transferase [Formivibrio citricus]|uniref:Leucyl/phenylalanyl-tRNA--protein transferase n=1 Tax=Formivibrio citricus TaxID=83765 RepID=A0A1I4WFP2_9NEIS|nr:leucyl/phenylalanyl-tRNA--protein transferase [Formivibrio citricus]SFN12664.1 leucyl/phenylalanyl-tRNA--protein transferase [Formivibrio citricus]